MSGWMACPKRTKWRGVRLLREAVLLDEAGNVVETFPGMAMAEFRRDGRSVFVPVPLELIEHVDFDIWRWMLPRARRAWRRSTAALAQRSDSR